MSGYASAAQYLVMSAGTHVGQGFWQQVEPPRKSPIPQTSEVMEEYLTWLKENFELSEDQARKLSFEVFVLWIVREGYKRDDAGIPADLTAKIETQIGLELKSEAAL